MAGTSEIPGRCDVVVIGGGPSGSSAANALAKAGYEVALLDKVAHPRNAVGESLIPHFWPYTDELGASAAIEAEGFVAKGGGLALWGDEVRQLSFRDFGYERAALHVERDVFDEILLRQAQSRGVQVFEGVRVARVEDIEGSPELHYTRADGEAGVLRASFVVDASGQSAVVATQLGIRQFDESVRFSAFWGYYRTGRYLSHGGEVLPFEDKFRVRPATLVSALGDWGWTWHITLRDKVSVGVILPRARVSALRAKTAAERERRFRELVSSTRVIGELLSPEDFIAGSLASVRDYAYRPTKLAVGQCYLAGDAAAFVDPINSAGVIFGMYAGVLAAHCIARSLERRRRTASSRELYASLYGTRLALFRLLAVPDALEQLSPEELEQAKRAIGESSEDERTLMMLQATLNVRSTALEATYRELGFERRAQVGAFDYRDIRF